MAHDEATGGRRVERIPGFIVGSAPFCNRDRGLTLEDGSLIIESIPYIEKRRL